MARGFYTWHIGFYMLLNPNILKFSKRNLYCIKRNKISGETIYTLGEVMAN